MGVARLHPFGKCDDIETGFVSVVARSVSSGLEGKLRTESTYWNVNDIESTVNKSGATTGTLVERSTSLKRKELGTSESRTSTFKKVADTPRPISSGDLALESSLMIQDSSEHEAAVKLQKVYKSFRTRRKLADCAVLVEQSWWKLLDFLELKRSSVSFFDVEKHETAISRWSRARTRAAKVGKGLSKNSKAQKLALQHWLEAIDPRHRYGHNLHFYYAKWLQSQSREPFFYWLDLGEGKDINLVEKCSRTKLHNQCIKYLGPMERKAYEIELVNGKFFNRQSGEILHTRGTKGAKWIFVLSTSRTLYIGRKQKGTFQHSSFLAGGATLAAGQLVVENGTLMAVWPHSGHYRPTEENFKDFISFLRENNVDLTNVQMTPADDEQISYHRQNSSLETRINSSEVELTQMATYLDVEQTNAEGLAKVKTNLFGKEANTDALKFQMPRKQIAQGRKLTYLEVPTREEFLQNLRNEDLVPASSENNFTLPPHSDGYESLDEEEEEEEHKPSKQNLSHDPNKRDCHTEAISEEIIKRVIPHNGSYQLGKQLSCTWTCGVGPRIGFVRDYPSELQNHALEKLNLSPRSTPVRSLHPKFTHQYRLETNQTITTKSFATPRHTASPSQRSLPHSLTLASAIMGS